MTTINKSELKTILQKFNGIIKQDSPLPILHNLLIEIENKNMTLKGTDLSLSLIWKSECKSNETVSFLVEFSKLEKIVKAITDETIDLNISESSLTITTFGGEYVLPINKQVLEYPAIQEKEGNPVSISGTLLLETIKKCSSVKGNDELRPILNGVYLEITEDYLIGCGTDAHKLININREAKDSQNERFVIPGDLCDYLTKNISSNMDINIYVTSRNIYIETDYFNLSGRLVEGNYPDFASVIPEVGNINIEVDRKLLISAIERVLILSNESTCLIKLSFCNNILQVIGEDTDRQLSGKEKLDCNYSGDIFEIGFHAKNLILMMKQIEDDVICFNFTDPSKAGVIRIESDCYLLMPMLIN